MNEDLHIVILAAGLSQRLGFPKQLILKNGITLLEEKIRLALSFSKNVMVVIPDIDTPWSKQIFAICQSFPVQIVTNPTPQTGMAQSIQLAYASLQKQNLASNKAPNHATNSRIIFLTIDQIALNYQHLTQLTPTADSQTIIASYYGEPKTLGIPVNVPFGFLAEFVPQLKGDKGFGKILNQLALEKNGYQVIAIDLPELVWDIDTVEQLAVVKPLFKLSIGSYKY